MKKLLITVSVLFLFSVAFAQGEYSQYSELLNSTTMPTDSEIMMIIDKFDFTPEQKEQLFRETKKQLKEIYETKNAALLEQRINQGKELLNNSNINVNDVMLPDVQKTDRKLELNIPREENPIR